MPTGICVIALPDGRTGVLPGLALVVVRSSGNIPGAGYARALLMRGVESGSRRTGEVDGSCLAAANRFRPAPAI